MYVFVSEKEHFSEFSHRTALFWLEEELQYGDWYAGPSSDGSFSKSGQVEISEVSCLPLYLFIRVDVLCGNACL